MFEAVKDCRDQDMVKCISFFPVQVFWEQCRLFLCVKNKFVSEKNLVHLKQDPMTLLNLYKIYSVHYITTKLFQIQVKNKKREKESEEAKDNVEKMDMQGYNSEQSDYSDSDFTELMSN